VIQGDAFHATKKSIKDKFTGFLYEQNKDNIYIDMQAGRNLLPKLPVADN